MLQIPYHEAAEQMLDLLLEQSCSVQTEVARLQKTNTIAAQGGFPVIHNNFQISKQIHWVWGVQRLYHWNNNHNNDDDDDDDDNNNNNNDDNNKKVALQPWRAQAAVNTVP
jgi:hypothetical protein